MSTRQDRRDTSAGTSGDDVRRNISRGTLVLLALVGALLMGAPIATAANPSANLDQCAKDPAPSPSSDGCFTSGSDWVNGNLGASKSVYQEGDSIPYRLTFANLSTSGTHTVTIE